MSKKVTVIIAVILIWIAAIASGVMIALKQAGFSLFPDRTITPSEESHDIGIPVDSDLIPDSSDWGSMITYKGNTWKRNRLLKTIVVMGIDSKAGVKANEMIGTGGRADTILVFVMNTENQTMKLLQVSRDTMINVDVYNDSRDLLYTGRMQINMQYAFGESRTRSCYLMKNKISDLLYGIPVDGYCSLTIDGMTKIVDAMGGITMMLDEDWSDINPSYKAGATVTMVADDVEHFVRYRDAEIQGSNDSRMDRQAWFLQKMFQTMKGYGSRELIRLYEAAGNDMTTDMDAETMQKFSKYTLDMEFLKLPGTTKPGEFHDEYILDEEKLRDLVMETFYQKVN